ncbi:MAG: glycosyltransferase family 9 protein [candidate division KSB1 bacterium]|nr:glycosyltransferase family 9 protein [candidate division KSB1 bacterium]MDZ7301615.1 glycosyltransferase family 9 protein [candidate division KSB1 bacterium]MDZ7310969.1 glycosyltransferase family 9 protein [candidate division KSB1 bacterium]
MPCQLDFTEVKRILVVRQHDMLGDFLLSTPVLRALHQRFPEAHIGVLVREYCADVARNNPYVNEVLVFYEHGLNWSWQRLRTLWRQLRRKWDLAVVLNTVSHSVTSDWLAHLSGARYILGSEHHIFPGCTRNFFYNLVAPYSKTLKHQSERNLDIVRHIGADTNNLSEVMHLDDIERQAAHQKFTNLGLRSGQLVIGMHVGAGKLMNRWPISRFSRLARLLREKYAAEIVLFWGPKEKNLSRQFCEEIRFQPVKVEPTDLRELAALFTQCDAVVCNDTGVMHVCAAVGVPLVAIFGPTDPKEWKPIGDKFVAARGKDQTVESVSVEQVLAALAFLLGERLERHAHKIEQNFAESISAA